VIAKFGAALEALYEPRIDQPVMLRAAPAARAIAPSPIR
jgi:hypothetical protein